MPDGPIGEGGSHGSRRYKDRFDLPVAAAARVLQRVHAIPIRQVDVGPCLHQKPDDPLMTFGPVTQNDGLQQSRPTKIVDVVHIDPRFDQGPNSVDMATLRSRDEGGAAIAIGAPEIRAVRERHRQDLEMTPRPSIEVGAVIDSILRVDIGTGLNQYPRNLDPVAVGCDEQRRASGFILCIDVGAARQKGLDLRRIDIPGCDSVQ
jgi:hypothetical protein